MGHQHRRIHGDAIDLSLSSQFLGQFGPTAFLVQQAGTITSIYESTSSDDSQSDNENGDPDKSMAWLESDLVH